MDWDLERAKKKPAWKKRSKLRQDSTPCKLCGSTEYKFTIRGKTAEICVRCYRRYEHSVTDFTQYAERIVTEQNQRGFGGTKERKYSEEHYSTKYTDEDN